MERDSENSNYIKSGNRRVTIKKEGFLQFYFFGVHSLVIFWKIAVFFVIIDQFFVQWNYVPATHMKKV